MGYRSEVVLVVGKEVMPQFMVTMAKSVEARAMCFDEADRRADYGEKGNMLFSWYDIKWYDSFEGVSAIGDFLDWCDAEKVPTDDPKIRAYAAECYKFVRLGEEIEDMEERGEGFWDVGVRRTIEF